MLAYLIKSSLLLVLFYGCYALLLRRETFHRFNRMVLLAIMLVSALFPLVEITVKDTWIVQYPLKPIYELQEKQFTEDMVVEKAMPAGTVDETVPLIAEETTVSVPQFTQQKDNASWHTAIPIWMIIYLAGVALMLTRFLRQIWELYRCLQGGMHLEDEFGNDVVIFSGDFAPRSFMRHIIISTKDYEQMRFLVMTHEQAHIRMGHSWDILLLEALAMLQWFNPVVCLLGRDLRSVHEYEADKAVLDNGINANIYQQLLVVKTVGSRLQTIAHRLNHGTLKERIIMMNKKKSNGMRMLKAAFVPAVMFVAAISFARTESSEVLPVKEVNPVLEPGISKIKEMEEASSRYAKNLKLFPKEIRESEVVNVLMNRRGDVMYRNGKQRIEPGYLSSVYGHLRKLNPTFVILVTDVSASAAELDKLINETYLYYTRHASDVHPVYFYSTTVDFHSTKSANRHKESSSKRRVVSEKTGKEYEKLWMMLHSSGLIQNAPPKSANAFIVDTLKLNTAYRNLAKNPNTQLWQQAYFEAFPKNWKEFINLYHFDKSGIDRTMYDLGYEQLQMFGNKLTLVNKDAYLNRLIDLATGAVLDADAPNYLQTVLHKFMEKDMENFMEQLSRRSSDVQTSFWSFYWSAPYHVQTYGKHLNRYNKVFKDDYPEMVRIMNECYKFNGSEEVQEQFVRMD